MAFGWKNTLRESAITPEDVYFNRRSVLAALGGVGASAVLPGPAHGRALASAPLDADAFSTRGPLDSPDPLNTYEDITTYNNYFEFGSGKRDPARYAGALTTDPWRITVDGLVDRPGVYDLREVIDGLTVEDRIYRLRCVEAWSMVIPWQGLELRDILNAFGPRETARFVHFETVWRPDEMRPARGSIPYPYRESLRLDEARHPLTIMAIGVYGRALPNQNGAPIRLVVPWKYGFKSIKSIVRITLSDRPIRTAWMQAAPREYGYYANVNPDVDHPRWSQATERVIGAGLFSPRRPTELFNGYAEEVGALYKGLDLRENF